MIRGRLGLLSALSCAVLNQTASSPLAIPSQPKHWVTNFLPFSPNSRRSSGDSKSSVIRRANSCGESAVSRCFPDSNSRPSAPIEVDTTAFLAAKASRIFRRLPPPIRKGTTTTVARARCGRTSSTSPTNSTPGNSESFRFNHSGGRRPTTRRIASGLLTWINGRISRVK